jgi:hypothetical protein
LCNARLKPFTEQNLHPHQDGGKTLIGMVRPSALLASLSESAELKIIAEQVEKDTIAIIEAAK